MVPDTAAPRGPRLAMRTHHRGRHAAPRRHVVAPTLLTGLLVTVTATVSLPAAANALAGDHVAAEIADSVSSPFTPGIDRTGSHQSASQGAPASTPTYRLVRGLHFKTVPPQLELPVLHYRLTGRFGQVSGLWAHTHTGLDFAAPEGTPIRSVAAGVVVSTGYDGAYGNKTVVRLLDGTVLWYCHQDEIVVHPGERVSVGERVGYVGSTGNTTGPHLHLEVHPHGGPPVDPDSWLVEHHLHP
jgi:murein DD-endopeptidase MepM/ murein hydrolase activator NlpD